MRVLGPTQRRLLIAGIGALCCVVSGLGFQPVNAQQARSISITPPAQLVDGQYVDVELSNFKPNNYVRVRLCAPTVASDGDCAADTSGPQDPAHSRLVLTGSDGTASTPFVIKAQDVPRMSDGSKFQCDANNACKLVGFELNGKDETLASSASVTLSYARSTLPCPETEPRVAGSGAASILADVVQWQSETCDKPLSLNVSYTTNNSVNGKQAFVQGLTDADFAMSGVPLTDAEHQTLASRKVQAVHVPVALGSLVLAYNLWVDDANGTPVQVRDLRLSPATVAGIIEGRISTWNDAAVSQDNPQYPNGLPSKLIVPVGRADNCAATWWLSSWLIAAAKSAWEAGGDSFKGGPTTIFPSGNNVDLRTGAANVALDIREFPGQPGSDGIPKPGLIGFVYLSDALKLGLPVASLQNAAGKYVQPTTDAVLAAAADGKVDSNGIFTPNFNNTSDAKAYPVPVVTYAIAPNAGTSLDPAHELVLSKFLHYVATDGQKAAELRGYAPLPAALSTKSDDGIGQIYAAPAVTPSPTAVTRTTSAPVTAASADATVAPRTAGTVASTPATSVVPVSSPGTEAAAPVTTSSTPSAPVAKVVAAAIKLLGGGSAPMTVSDFLWLGAIAAIVGRALTLLAEHRRRRRATPGLKPVPDIETPR